MRNLFGGWRSRDDGGSQYEGDVDRSVDLDLPLGLAGEDLRPPGDEIGDENSPDSDEEEGVEFSPEREAEIDRLMELLELKKKTEDLAHPAISNFRPELLSKEEQAAIAPLRDRSWKPPTSVADVALRAMDARDQILSTVSNFGPDARTMAMSVISGTPADALAHPLAVELISNFAIGEAVRRGRLSLVTGPGVAQPSVSGHGATRAIRSFQVVFGDAALTEAERAELRAVGL